MAPQRIREGCALSLSNRPSTSSGRMLLGLSKRPSTGSGRMLTGSGRMLFSFGLWRRYERVR
jgi:hypothetical protein